MTQHAIPKLIATVNDVSTSTYSRSVQSVKGNVANTYSEN